MSLLGSGLMVRPRRVQSGRVHAREVVADVWRMAMPLALLSACTGTVGGGDNPEKFGSGNTGGKTPEVVANVDPNTNPPVPPPLAGCEGAPRVGPAPLRRLTNSEYANTLRDLLGLSNSDDLVKSFPNEGEGHGFDNNAETSTISTLRTQKMFDASEKAIAAFDPTQKLPCAASGLDDACVKQFIERFGTRAMRRPPTDEETASLLGLSTTLGSSYTPRERLGAIVQALLMSPQFNFLPEFGDAAMGEAPSGFIALSSYEMASRLSYFVWNSMPDDVLFEAAAKNSLSDSAELSRQVKRMLADPKAKDSVANFARQWTDVDRLNPLGKDAALFPNWNQAMVADLRADIEGFFSHAMLDSKDGWSKLMTSHKGFITPTSAKIYEVTAPNDGTSPAAMDLPDVRPGFMTRPGFLAAHAQSRFPSPISRGVFVRRELLCQELGSPPDGAAMKPEAMLGPTATNRDIKTAHSADPKCVGCHRIIDPPGFAFESFDAIGRYSLTEKAANGTTVNVDTRGKLEGTDVDGDFETATDLTKMLSRSGEAQACVVRQWFRYSRGRLNLDSDECSISDLTRAFNLSGGDFGALFSAMVTHDSFRFRPVTAK